MALQKGEGRLKGDERILGDSDFVMKMLEQCEEGLQRRYRLLQAGGYDFGKLLRHAAAERELTALLGRKVDLVSRRALRSALREEILSQARPIYAA